MQLIIFVVFGTFFFLSFSYNSIYVCWLVNITVCLFDRLFVSHSLSLFFNYSFPMDTGQLAIVFFNGVSSAFTRKLRLWFRALVQSKHAKKHSKNVFNILFQSTQSPIFKHETWFHFFPLFFLFNPFLFLNIFFHRCMGSMGATSGKNQVSSCYNLIILVIVIIKTFIKMSKI